MAEADLDLPVSALLESGHDPRASGGTGRFQDLGLLTRYSSTDDILNGFYVPVLSRAVTYDRMAGYFASSVFVTAAAGLARFVANDGSVRLLVGAQLTATDRDALLGNVPLEDVLARRLLNGVLLDADEIARRRFEVIAWLVRAGRLEIRVGVPCDTDGVPLADTDATGYFHSKYGIVADAAGDRIVFAGSINESGAGWSQNFETFSVYPSWKAEVWAGYGQPSADEFERLWRGESMEQWRTMPLPEAVRERLIGLLPADEEWAPPASDPAEPLSDTDRGLLERIRDAPSTCTGVGLASSGVEPWPHQLRIARRIVDTWPRSYLLSDEVGLGKTIEAGLVLRELLLSGRASTALVLVPASVLLQWQEELAEKFLLDVPRLEGRRLCWADPERPPREIPSMDNPWRAAPVILASSHLARRRSNRAQLLNGRGWDLVVLDEAHHARRRGSKPTDTPNEMLATLSEMCRRGLWRALLMASATPMQLHSHDLWDLLSLCGLPPCWDAGADALESYYSALMQPFEQRPWRFLQDMLAGHFETVEADRGASRLLEEQLGWVASDCITQFHKSVGGHLHMKKIPSEQHSYWDRWLRANTPVRDRVFRTTRATLAGYRTDGVLPAETVIPERRITDEFLPLGDARPVYDRIENYIVRHYDNHMRAGGVSTPLGFIMTVYRRRLTSSFHAIRKSLERRRDVLRHRRELLEMLDEDDAHTLEAGSALEELYATLPAGIGADTPSADRTTSPAAHADDPADNPAGVGADIDAELEELDSFIRELSGLPPDEPKMARLHSLLAESFNSGHRTVVVFTQYTDTLHYVREQLRSVYGRQLVCYSGGRGERCSQSLDSGAGGWESLDKEEVKDLFRRGEEVRILLGTDSMSEGLNLQTCDRLVNFDLPWNFMRVEQRIGRVDRIGGKPLVHVTNLFYENTVEDDIYRRIKNRYEWFTNVVGNAQPVLAAAESAIEQAAMGRSTAADAADELTRIIDRMENAPLTHSDLDSVPEHSTELAPDMDLPGLRGSLLSIGAIRSRLHPHPSLRGAWLLEAGAAKHPITFDPALYNEEPGLKLLTWGSPLLSQLLKELPQKKP